MGEVGSKGWRWGGLGEWSEHGANLIRVKVRVKENRVEIARSIVQFKEDWQVYQRALEPTSATKRPCVSQE